MFSTLTPADEKTDIVPARVTFAVNDAARSAGNGKSLCLVSDTRAADNDADNTARLFARDGWRVTLLDLSPFQSGARRSDGAPYLHVPLAGQFNDRNWYTPMQALCAYHWLKASAQDLVIFQHGFGAGYFCCAAREAGLDFSETVLAVMADDTYAFRLQRAHHFPTAETFRTDSEIDYLERQTVARADAVLVTGQPMLDWLNQAGWLAGKNAASVAQLHAEGTRSASEWLAGCKTGRKKPAQNTAPSISVCIVADGNPRYLDELLASLRAQTAGDFELIVAQAANAEAGIDDLRQAMTAEFPGRGWSWIESPHTDKARLSNDMAHRARGDYVYFIDSDDVCLPDAIALLQTCLRHQPADIIGAVTGKHANSDNTITAFARFPSRLSPADAPVPVGWIYYGANLATCLAVNVIGNNCCLFRKKVFTALGGFQTGVGAAQYGCGLLFRAAQKGHAIHVLPEILTLSRRDKNGRILWSRERFNEDAAMLGLLAENMPPELRAALLPFRAFNNVKKYVPRFTTPGSQRTDNRHAEILPAPQTGVIRIALCADEHYLEQVCVAIASLCCSAQNGIDIYLITSMSADKAAKASSVAAHFGHSLTIIPADKRHDARIPAGTMWSKGSNATYWRLWLPDYLPELDKVLYLDSDLIARQDLARLWATDLGNHLLAAARDPAGVDIPGLARDCGGDYFNAGVLLVNLAAWRRENIKEKALSIAEEWIAQNYPYQFHDQSPLNKATAGRWLALSPTWNYNEDIAHHAALFHLDPADLAVIGDDPAIYHFRTNKKPWFPDYPPDAIYGREYRVYEKMVHGLMRSCKGNANV